MSDLTKQRLLDLSDAKLKDAKLLLNSGRAGNAYYLAGYAVELLLKAILSMSIQAETIPSRELMRDIFTHDLERLVRLAGLYDALKSKIDAEPQFAARWQIVDAWDEKSRYEIRELQDASALIEAIDHADHGVLQWLRARL